MNVTTTESPDIEILKEEQEQGEERLLHTENIGIFSMIGESQSAVKAIHKNNAQY